MVPLSLSFLIPAVMAQVAGDIVPRAAWAVLPAVALIICALVPRARRHVPAIMAGVVLFAARGISAPAESDRGEPPGVAIPVIVDGEVSSAPYRRGAQLLIPLAGAPPLALVTHAQGPLPGSRVRARGRLEAHGYRITLPGLEALQVLEPPRPGDLSALLERTRRALRERLQRGLGSRADACMRTLLLGDRALTFRDRSRLARTGTLHLFALSGLHLAVFLSLLRRGLGPWNMLLLALILFYASLTGFRSPMGRAFLLEAGGLLGQRLGRRTRRGSHLLLAMTVLLAWNPQTLRSVGFLLSFSAYAGIHFLAGPVLERLRRDPLEVLETGALARLRRALTAPFLVALSAFAASLPVTLAVFHRVSWTAIPGSILLGPAVPVLLLLGFILMIFPGFPPALLMTELMVHLLHATVSLLDHVPGSPVSMPRATPVAHILYILAGVHLAVNIARRRRARRAVQILAASALLFGVPVTPPEGFTLLDAGRGSALLVSSGNDRWLLDCGPREAHVADQLLALGVGHLDGIVVSHRQEDHDGGLEEILRRIGAEQVCAPDHFSRGATLGSEALSLDFLWPDPRVSLPSTNDRSLVPHIRTPRGTILAPGDLESRGLMALLDAGPLPHADILLAPHHGAGNRALLDLLLLTTPSEVWIPARAGFPDEGTMLLLHHTALPYRGTW